VGQEEGTKDRFLASTPAFRVDITTKSIGGSVSTVSDKKNVPGESGEEPSCNAARE